MLIALYQWDTGKAAFLDILLLFSFLDCARLVFVTSSSMLGSMPRVLDFENERTPKLHTM